MKYGVYLAFWLLPIPCRQKHGESVTRWWMRYTACILKDNKGSRSICLCHLVSLRQCVCVCVCVWCELSRGAGRRRLSRYYLTHHSELQETLWLESSLAANMSLGGCTVGYKYPHTCICVRTHLYGECRLIRRVDYVFVMKLHDWTVVENRDVSRTYMSSIQFFSSVSSFHPPNHPSVHPFINLSSNLSIL